MTDRTPTKFLENGAIRYGVYDEAGTFLRFEYIRPEDEPTDAGTPLNSNTLLKPSTAERLGLDRTAFPDDALNALDEQKADAAGVAASLAALEAKKADQAYVDGALETLTQRVGTLITCGTSDLNAGSSPLATGTVYLVYE